MPGPTFSPPRLRALREHRRLSREQLGVRIDRTPGAVEQYEQGLNYPSTPTLGALAHALDVSVDELFDDGDPGDPRARYIRAVTDLMPAMTDQEIDQFGAIVRARRATPSALSRRERAVSA